MECNSFDGRDASYCKRARFADRKVRATLLGSVNGEWRPNCVLTIIPPSPQRMHKVGQPASGTGETPVPLAGASAVTDC